MTALASAVPSENWRRLSCGAGSQGLREYDWAVIPLRPALQDGWVHRALFRRHPDRPDDIAFYLVYAPTATPLAELVRAAGARWTIEAVFKLAKGQVGLDQYEVRSCQGWYRHITLALLALAVLAIGAAKKGEASALGTSPSPSPNSGACSPGSAGRRRASRPRSSPGPAGATTTNASPKCAIAVGV